MSSTTIKAKFPPVSIAAIEDFERRRELSLPDTYKNFLATHNGGEPTPDRLFVLGWAGISTCIDTFFGLGAPHYYDLEAILENSADYIPAGTLPIAIDPGGNMLCLMTKGSKAGSVYFWDHESPEGTDLGKLFEVASSIDGVLSKLS